MPNPPSEETPLFRMMTPADWVSCTNALLGVSAILAISLNHVPLAVALILVAVIGDGLDGFLARRGHGGGPFGEKLDSFADFIAFCIAPATLIYHEYYQWEVVTAIKGPALLTSLAIGSVAALFVVTGMLRLIRFEVLKGSSRSDFFIGLSTPAAALVVLMAAYVGLEPGTVIPLTIIVSLLMVSRIRFPKVRGPLTLPTLILILGTLVVQQRFGNSVPLTLLAFIGIYVLIGPLLVRWREARAGPEDVEPVGLA